MVTTSEHFPRAYFSFEFKLSFSGTHRTLGTGMRPLLSIFHPEIGIFEWIGFSWAVNLHEYNSLSLPSSPLFDDLDAFRCINSWPRRTSIGVPSGTIDCPSSSESPSKTSKKKTGFPNFFPGSWLTIEIFFKWMATLPSWTYVAYSSTLIRQFGAISFPLYDALMRPSMKWSPSDSWS